MATAGTGSYDKDLSCFGFIKDTEETHVVIILYNIHKIEKSGSRKYRKMKSSSQQTSD
jgi:hypothetical protein